MSHAQTEHIGRGSSARSWPPCVVTIVVKVLSPRFDEAFFGAGLWGQGGACR
jgi:hypothetical protein